MFVGLLLPAGLGYLLTGTLKGALTGLFWGGFVRIFMLHHVTWSINSVCHFFGRRRFDIEDHSTNVFWLALPSFGESWHHNHHAFPRSAVHGLKWWEVDPSAGGHPRHEAAEAGLERGRDLARAPGAEDRARARARRGLAPQGQLHPRPGRPPHAGFRALRDHAPALAGARACG